MQRIELSAFLSGTGIFSRAHWLVLGLKVAMEVIAALKVAKATGQRSMESVGNQRDAVIREGGGPGV